MDTTIIFTLVLSAFFIGGILWIVVQARHQQRARAAADERAARPSGETPRRGKV